MLTKTGLSDTVEPSSSPENFDREGDFEISGRPAKLEPRHHFQPSRDNLPNPKPTEGNAYVPANSPAIGDLFDLFDFDKKVQDND